MFGNLPPTHTLSSASSNRICLWCNPFNLGTQRWVTKLQCHIIISHSLSVPLYGRCTQIQTHNRFVEEQKPRTAFYTLQPSGSVEQCWWKGQCDWLSKWSLCLCPQSGYCEHVRDKKKERNRSAAHDGRQYYRRHRWTHEAGIMRTSVSHVSLWLETTKLWHYCCSKAQVLWT